jgi:hypothetical protein
MLRLLACSTELTLIKSSRPMQRGDQGYLILLEGMRFRVHEAPELDYPKSKRHRGIRVWVPSNAQTKKLQPPLDSCVTQLRLHTS